MGKIANRQSLAFSERGQLSQAIPQFHAERIQEGIHVHFVLCHNVWP